MKAILFSLLILFAAPQTFLFGFEAQPKIERRAAFDIGSGKIKMEVADVDVTTNKIAKVIFTDTAVVALREDLGKSLDGKLSSEIQNKTVRALSQLINKAEAFKPQDYRAVATEALRLAKNGNALAERIKRETGLSVTIVTQEEEGILGFISAASEAGLDPEKVVSWDSGSGSFQITTKCGDHFSVYQGRIGKVPVKNALLKIQRKKDQTLSPNPVSRSEAYEALSFVYDNITKPPYELRQKLQHRDVVVLGIGNNPLWGIQCSKYDIDLVKSELHRRLGLDDEAIRVIDSISEDRKETAAYVVSNLILAYGVMKSFDIRKVQYVGTQGANARGALLSPKYWNHPGQ